MVVDREYFVILVVVDREFHKEHTYLYLEVLLPIMLQALSV